MRDLSLATDASDVVTGDASNVSSSSLLLLLLSTWAPLRWPCLLGALYQVLGLYLLPLQLVTMPLC